MEAYVVVMMLMSAEVMMITETEAECDYQPTTWYRSMEMEIIHNRTGTDPKEQKEQLNRETGPVNGPPLRSVTAPGPNRPGTGGSRLHHLPPHPNQPQQKQPTQPTTHHPTAVQLACSVPLESLS